MTNTYRHDGLRHSRIDATSVSTMVWDRDDVLFVEGANAQACMRGPELARAVGASVNRFYHADAMQTIQAITDAGQTLETDYTTDAWGNVVSGSASGNPFVYHGGLGYWSEAGLGLNYVRARWLEPGSGSWLSIDPVSGEPRYSYARNMPTTRVDPSGQEGYVYIPGGPTPREMSEGIQRFFGDAVGAWRSLLPKNGIFGIRQAQELIRREFQKGEQNWRFNVELAAAALATSHQMTQAVFPGFTPPGITPFSFFALVVGQNIWNQIRSHLGPLQIVLPPAPGTAQALEYWGGFLWAAVELLWGMTGGLALDSVSLLDYLLTFPNLLADFKQFIQEGGGGILKELKNAGGRPPYDQGKMLGYAIGAYLAVRALVRGAQRFLAKRAAAAAAKAAKGVAPPHPPESPEPTLPKDDARHVDQLADELRRRGQTEESIRGRAANRVSEAAQAAEQALSDEFNRNGRRILDLFAAEYSTTLRNPREGVNRIIQIVSGYQGSPVERMTLMGWLYDRLTVVDPGFQFREGFIKGGGRVFFGAPTISVVSPEGAVYKGDFRLPRRLPSGEYEIDYGALQKQ